MHVPQERTLGGHFIYLAMKRAYSLLVLLGLACLILFSQDYLVLYRLKDRQPISIPLIDVECILHDNDSVQTIVTKSGTIETFISEIDSLAFVSIHACIDENHPHMIDLGLPSDTKWACCNIGADAPEGYGSLFAWGETEEKTRYALNNYAYLDENEKYDYLGEDIAGTAYDVSYVNWGDSWRIPSDEQIKELLDNCTFKWFSLNEVCGLLVAGSNGATIFLPAAGYGRDSINGGIGTGGNYWSSTALTENNDAYGLYFDAEGWYRGYSSRYDGRTVRAVCQ